METITLNKHVGSDGILDLRVPVNVQDADVQVTVSYSPKTSTNVELHYVTSSEARWPEGYFDRTYGSLAHAPLERDFEGEFDTRDDLE